ncbi:MAG: hypothetical protein NT029_14045 [Armatimonadetes bacterium]|nr:hypothetical protein [Armatimonadota bacterium]
MSRRMLPLAVATFVGLAPLAAVAGPEPETPPMGPVFHLDAYWGLSNMTGAVRRHIDGQWAGAMVAYPSKAGLDWNMADGSSARVSLGLGDIQNGADRCCQQPEEAYWSGRLPHDGRVWVGKRYVPFAAQAWEYEAKWGVAADTTVGGLSLSSAAAYDDGVRRGNAYARLGKKWENGSAAGLSIGAGRGLLFGSVHDLAIGADATRRLGRCTLVGEALEAMSSQGSFRFAAVTAEFDTRTRYAPYLSWIYGNDASGDNTNLRSATGGVIIGASKTLTVEPGAGVVNGKGVWWMQCRVRL